jgi:hypothetical protein
MEKAEYLTTSQFFDWLKPFIPALRRKHIHAWCDNGRLRCESLRLKGDRSWKRIPIRTECIRFLNDELDFSHEERKLALQALKVIAHGQWRQKQLTLDVGDVKHA